MKYLQMLYDYMSVSYFNVFMALVVSVAIFYFFRTMFYANEGTIALLGTLTFGVVLVIVISASIPCLFFRTRNTLIAGNNQVREACEATIYEACGGKNTLKSMGRKLRVMGISFSDEDDISDSVNYAKEISKRTTQMYDEYISDSGYQKGADAYY